jgi:hypothetical protein
MAQQPKIDLQDLELPQLVEVKKQLEEVRQPMMTLHHHGTPFLIRGPRYSLPSPSPSTCAEQ